MADKAHIDTDKKLDAMERHLSAIYSKAQKLNADKMAEYAKKQKQKAEILRANIKAAKTPAEALEAKKQYISFYSELMKSKSYKEISSFIANSLYQTNITASSYINEHTPGIYADNYNYMGDSLKRGLTGYNYDPITEQEAKSYGAVTMQTIEKEADKKWNEKNLKKSIIAGAIIALSADAIFKRAAKITTKKNHDSANLHARDMGTDAESKGRLDGMYRAEDCGFVVKKKWLATLDNRTRDSHRELDGTTIEPDEEFLPGLSRPRDPHGPAREVCNCRCTLTWTLDGVSKSTRSRAARSGTVKGSYKKGSSFAGTRTISVPDMTYAEWMEWRNGRS